MKCASIKLFVGLALSLLAVTGCRQEDIRPQAESGDMGRIVLSLSNAEVFLDIETRTENTLENFVGYAFTLVREGEETSIVFDEDGAYILEAGTYSLKVDNWESSKQGTIAPYYCGTSESFEVKAGETTAVEINLGKPRNAQVTVMLDSSFTDKYTIETFSLGGREVKEQSLYFAVPEEGKLSYTLSAKAVEGTNITDITSAEGTIEIAGGCRTTLTLKADSVTGKLIAIMDGGYDGEFD